MVRWPVSSGAGGPSRPHGGPSPTPADPNLPEQEARSRLRSPPHPPAPVSVRSISPVGGPPDEVYSQAAAIFHRLQQEKPLTQQLLRYAKKTDTPTDEPRDTPAQREAHRLAFNTLKYQDLLEDVMTDSCFHISQQISDDSLPLAMVMLFDLQDRKFVPPKRSTQEGEELQQEVRQIESSLHRCATKLAASLARCRVKQNLQSVSCVLSVPVRTSQTRASHLPVYAWVNTLNNSVEDVCETLQGEGVREVECVRDLRGSVFCRDPLCPDTLLFPSPLSAWLQHCKLTTDRMLNVQDRSVCASVCALGPLLWMAHDVLVVGSFSPLTVAHVAALADACSGRVLLCRNDHGPSHREELEGLLTHMEIKNVHVLSEEFLSLNESDTKLQRLKVILVVPQCSSSALHDPVDTLLAEHGDVELLQHLSRGAVSQSKVHTLARQQARLLAFALSFSKVDKVVYCTRSVYPEENELLVRGVLDKVVPNPKLLPFRLSGPVLSQRSGAQPGGDQRTQDKFFRVEPSELTSGCFIALLAREADPSKVDSVQDVLARAAAKGLLGGILPGQPKQSKKEKPRLSIPSSQSRSVSRQQEPVSLHTEPVSGQEPGSSLAAPGHVSPLQEGSERGGELRSEGEEKVGKGVVKRRAKRSKAKPKPLPQRPSKKSKPHHARKRPARARALPTSPTKAKDPIPGPPDRPSPSTLLLSTLHPDPPTALRPHPPPALGQPPGLPLKHPPPGRSAGPPRGTRNDLRPWSPDNDSERPKKALGPSGRAGQEVLKPVDFVLPPISSPSLSSLGSRSGSSLPFPPPRVSPSAVHSQPPLSRRNPIHRSSSSAVHSQPPLSRRNPIHRSSPSAVHSQPPLSRRNPIHRSSSSLSSASPGSTKQPPPRL